MHIGHLHKQNFNPFGKYIALLWKGFEGDNIVYKKLLDMFEKELSKVKEERQIIFILFSLYSVMVRSIYKCIVCSKESFQANLESYFDSLGCEVDYEFDLEGSGFSEFRIRRKEDSEWVPFILPWDKKVGNPFLINAELNNIFSPKRKYLIQQVQSHDERIFLYVNLFQKSKAHFIRWFRYYLPDYFNSLSVSKPLLKIKYLHSELF